MLSYYYDACALEEGREYYREFLDRQNPHICVVGFLSLGEAYGNAHRKGASALEAFTKLMGSIGDKIRVVGHQDIKSILEDTLQEFPALELTDAIHLATAIREKCSILRTADRDLFGLHSGRVATLAKRHGCSQFAITRVSLAPKRRRRRS